MRRKPKSQKRSKLGNPFPVGLKPADVPDDIMGGFDVEATWARQSYNPGAPQPYLYEPPDPSWPRLNLYPAGRGPRETEEQYAIFRRGFERGINGHAIFLGLCQRLCTFLGNHRACPVGTCRRKGACAGIRDQTRYWLPLLIYPPCIPLDREIIETFRDEIKAELVRAGL